MESLRPPGWTVALKTVARPTGAGRGVAGAAWPDILSLSPATDTPYSSKPLQQTPARLALSVRADVDLTRS